MPDPLDQAKSYLRDLFSCLDEFFVRATGKSAISFSSIENFSDEIHRNDARFASRGTTAFPWLFDTLGKIYAAHAVGAFRIAKQIGGLKLVQAGQRFTNSHLRSVQTSLLYADTI